MMTCMVLFSFHNHAGDTIENLKKTKTLQRCA